MAQARPFRGPPAAPVSPLKGANVLIIDANVATAKLLRSQLEDRGAAAVDIAVDENEALDVLGNVPRPVLLAMMDTLTGGGTCVAVLRVLCKHRARIHVTLLAGTHQNNMPCRATLLAPLPMSIRPPP